MKFFDLAAQQKIIQPTLDTAMQTVFAHQQFILGPEVKQLEQQLADFVGVKHCISVASGTDALLLALMCLDIGPGDEVITTPFSFIAPSEMIAFLGATPVFVDIDPHSYNIAPDLIESAITDKTKAILPVSLFGQCANLTAINAIAKRHGIPVIEDAAQSFGATHHGKPSCSMTDIACTSFFPTKPLAGYGDGGACFTDNDAHAEKIRALSMHGQRERYIHQDIGITGRLDTLQAAILLCKLAIFPDEIQLRQEIAAKYAEGCKVRGMAPTNEMIEGVQYPFIAPENTSVFAQYTLQITDRDAAVAYLKAAGIPTAIHYSMAIYQQPSMQGRSRCATPMFHCEAACTRVLSVPMHPYLSDDDRRAVLQTLSEINQLHIEKET